MRRSHSIPVSNSPPLLSVAAIRTAGRRLPVPFRLPVIHSGRVQELFCTQLLRIVPFNRVVLAGQWDDRPVVAKIFLKRLRGVLQCRRELRGVRAMQRAGIRSPCLLVDCSMSPGNHPLLIFEQIAPAEHLGRRLVRPGEWAASKALLDQGVRLIAQQHEAGLFQTDPHLGNWLVCNDALHAIDAGTIRQTLGGRPLTASTGIANLGKFLAELPEDFDDMTPGFCQSYLQARLIAAGQNRLENLRRAIRKSRSRRLRAYLGKTTRECGEFARFFENGLMIVCRRDHDTPELRRILVAPDEAIARGSLLKAGNSATAALIRTGTCSFVIKRYNLNLRPLTKAVRAFLRPSRARISWLNAHRLRALKIPSPAPIALVERRLGPIRTTGYFVSEYIAGDTGDRVFRRTDLSHSQICSIAAKTAQLLGRLWDAGLTHGDLKGSNLLYCGNEPLLLDLDATRRHRIPAVLRFRRARDCRRLMQNFAFETPLSRELIGQIGEQLRSIDDQPDSAGINPTRPS